MSAGPSLKRIFRREPFVSFRKFVLEGRRKADQRRRPGKFTWNGWHGSPTTMISSPWRCSCACIPIPGRPGPTRIFRLKRHACGVFLMMRISLRIVIKQGRMPLLTIPFYRAVGRDYFLQCRRLFKFILASDYGRYPAASHYGVLSGERRISWLHPLTIGWRTSEREGDTLQTLDLPPCIPFTLEQQNRWSSRKQVGEKALFVLDRMKFKVEAGMPETAVCGESL